MLDEKQIEHVKRAIAEAFVLCSEDSRFRKVENELEAALYELEIALDHAEDSQEWTDAASMRLMKERVL